MHVGIGDRESSRSPAGVVVLAAGLAMWFLVMAYSYLRPSFWVFDLVVVPVMWILAGLGFVCIVVGVVLLRPVLHSAGAVAIVAVVAAVSVTVGTWWQVSPQRWFATHRVLYERALAVDPGDGRALLPLHLRFLSSDGRVHGDPDRPGLRYFPQRSAFPDFSGGYFHSPSGPPEGFNMQPVPCVGAASLGGSWWKCGMRD